MAALAAVASLETGPDGGNAGVQGSDCVRNLLVLPVRAGAPRVEGQGNSGRPGGASDRARANVTGLMPFRERHVTVKTG